MSQDNAPGLFLKGRNGTVRFSDGQGRICLLYTSLAEFNDFMPRSGIHADAGQYRFPVHVVRVCLLYTSSRSSRERATSPSAIPHLRLIPPESPEWRSAPTSIRMPVSYTHLSCRPHIPAHRNDHLPAGRPIFPILQTAEPEKPSRLSLIHIS